MTPRNVVILGDCIERLRELPADSVDAIVTDPPYGLEFMGKAWDGFDTAHAFGEWCRQWAIEALRVLKPGGHLLAFGGTRTYHRLVCGIEDAGFEIRDTIAWLYGSGFPKSKNIGNGFGTALKPAHEPIVVARKPLTGTVAANVERHGTGALNIDGCRVECAGERVMRDFDRQRQTPGIANPNGKGGLTGVWENTLGRWPANVAHDGSVDVLQLFPEGSFNKPGVFGRDENASRQPGYGMGEHDVFGYGDRGSAARFFYCAKASRADREAGLVGLPERVVKTQGRVENRTVNADGSITTHGDTRQARANDHPTVKPHDLMRWLVRLVGGQRGSLILDPFAGSGSTLRAARAEGFDFLGIERDPHYYRLACLRAGLPDPGEVAA